MKSIQRQLEGRRVYLNFSYVENSKLDYDFFKKNKLDALIFFIDSVDSEKQLKNILTYCSKYKIKIFLITKEKSSLEQFYLFHYGISSITATDEISIFLNQFLLTMGLKTNNHDASKFPMTERLKVYSINHIQSMASNEFVLKTPCISFKEQEVLRPLFSMTNLNKISSFIVNEMTQVNNLNILNIKPQFDKQVVSLNKEDITTEKSLEEFILSQSKSDVLYPTRVSIFLKKQRMELSKLKTRNVFFFNEALGLINNLIDDRPDIIFYDLNNTSEKMTKLILWKINNEAQKEFGYKPLIVFSNAIHVIDGENVYLNKELTEVDINAIVIKYNYNKIQNEKKWEPVKLAQSLVYFPDEIKIASISKNQISFFSTREYLEGACFYLKDYKNFMIKIENVKEIGNKKLYVSNILGGDEINKVNFENFVNSL